VGVSRDVILAIGTAAAVLTTISFLPQVIKAHRTRHTGDLSLVMLVLLAAGIALWLVYGIMLGEAPMMGANSVTLVLVSYLLVLKIRYG
jgi:MtN3 and saliva related transmembrane protein